MTSVSDCVIQQEDLSLGQKELWYIHSLEGAAQSAYNESLIYSLKGFLSINTLKKAFQALMNKHPMLRTSIEKDYEGTLLQKIHEQPSLDFSIIEHLDKTTLNEAIVAVLKKTFHLHHPSLMRVVVFQLSQDERVLVLVLHHLIVDGTSFGILIEDLNAFYQQVMQQAPAKSEPSSKSYFDCLHLEQKNFLSPSYQHRVTQLSHTLKGYSGLNFLTTPKAQDIYSGNRVYFTLNKDLYKQLSAFSQSQRATLFHVLYATYCILLNRYTRSQDIVIGVPFANRGHDLERQVLGYFINTLPVRVEIHPDEQFTSLIARIKSTLFTCLGAEDVTFEHLARELNLNRKAAGQHPLIQTLFVWGNTDKLKLKIEGVHTELHHQFHNSTAKFDLSLFMLEENKETISAYFEYKDRFFDPTFIERLANSFITLLQHVLDTPHTPVSQFSLLDYVTKERMKKEFFTAKLDRVVTTNLATLFSESAIKHSTRTGLIFKDKHYSYDFIEARSNQWASYIREKYQQLEGHELKADTLIALYVERCEDMIFGVLGILKAGAAYVPVDPQYPKERINYMLNHSKASLLLTHKQQDLQNLDFSSERIVYMDNSEIELSPFFVNQPTKHSINPKSLAYVLYTSGSTGQPKGVGVSHENVICLFESLKKQFSFDQNDVWSLFHTFCFDISVWEIWGAFLFGGSLLIIPYETSRDPKEFYQLIASEKVSVLTQTASAFQMFINEDLKNIQKLAHLRYVSFVGESLKVSILRPWVKKYGTQQPRLANMYGITETTVYTNNKFIELEDIDKGRDNIGWPLEEFSMCVMDEQMQWCPVGIVGEICIGGRGLSRGYLHRDDLTREKFITDPYATYLGIDEASLLYRTGDLGRWLDDGSIEYLGRKDFQIKLRGFRIELGEIESALGSYSNISHTTVLLKGEGESAYLAAYYTLKPNSQVDASALHAHLQSYLPDYMIPSTFSELDSFPMTVNGKIDRKALSEYDDKNIQAKNIVPLRTELEQQIAHIWATILNLDVDRIGATSNFFELGGNSLLVVKLLTLIKNQLGIDFSLSQFVALPCIATLSANAQGTNIIQKGSLELLEHLQKDILLDSSIQPLQECNKNALNPKALLLTGASGFLGAHMLYEFLENTHATLYCLVREATPEKGFRKITHTLQKYQLFTNQDLTRIIPLLGDLNKEKVGLSDKDYIKICQEVDAIYHAGALVHHVYDYQTLYKPNVQSTVELLKIASLIKNKSVHFISTLATEYISPVENLPLIAQDKRHSHLDLNGYLTSKWVSEQLLQEANKRGFTTHVYRPGNIIAGAKGIYEPQSNHTLLRLKGMLQLGKGWINAQEQVEMMPVDLLAKAILTISQKPKLFAYNLHNAYTLSWIEYLKMAINEGYCFNFINEITTWNHLLSHLPEDNALYKLAHLYQLNKEASYTKPDNELSLTPDYKISTPTYSVMVKQQLNALVQSKFLPSPSKIHEDVL